MGWVGGVLQTERTLCNFVDPISICRANSPSFPTSQRESSSSGTLNPCTRSVSPVSPSWNAKASARAMFDCVGCIKMSSGFGLDRGVFGKGRSLGKSGRDTLSVTESLNLDRQILAQVMRKKKTCRDKE